MVELTEEGRRLKREYYREYYRKNNRKIRDSRNSYWNKKAARSAAAVGDHYETAEAHASEEQRERLEELFASKRQTEQERDLSPETRMAKIRAIDHEIAALKRELRMK